MEEAPENGKESSHSALANGMNECPHIAVTDTVNRIFHTYNKFKNHMDHEATSSLDPRLKLCKLL